MFLCLRVREDYNPVRNSDRYWPGAGTDAGMQTEWPVFTRVFV